MPGAGGMLQHDKQATSRCLCAARYSALRIPHSALRIRSQNRPPPRSCTLGATGWSAVDRTIRECGMRSAECGMLFADRGDWAMQTGPIIMCAGGCSNMTSRRLHTAFVQLGIPHCAFRIPHSAFVPRTGLHHAAARSEQHGWSAVDRTIRECGMRSAECGMLFADRGDWAMQTGPFTICAGGTLQHDKQATSRCLCAARYSALRIRIPHSAFVPRTGLHHAAARSEQPDGRPWIERLGNAECGVRNAECCLQIEATGRCRQDRSLCARADAPTRQAGDFTLPLCSSVFRIAHSAFRTPHSFPEQASTTQLHARSNRMVDRGSND